MCKLAAATRSCRRQASTRAGTNAAAGLRAGCACCPSRDRRPSKREDCIPLKSHARSLEASGYSVIYVGWGQRVHAVLSLDDLLLPEARSAIDARRSRGRHLILLTGDLPAAAQRIAAAVGIETEDIRGVPCPGGQAGCLGSAAPTVRSGGDGRRWPQWGRSWPTRTSASPSAPPPTSLAKPRHSCCPPVGLGCCRGRSTSPARFDDDPHQPDVGVRL